MGFPMTDDGRNLDEILKSYYKVFPKVVSNERKSDS